MTPGNCCKLLPPLIVLSALAGARAVRAQAPATPAADVTATPTRTGARHGYSIFKGTLVEMTWPEVRAAASAGALVLVPVGVIEEHGPHMGLGADTYMAYRACTLLQDALRQRQVPVVVAPPIYWGVMQLHETGAYPGSFTVRPETMHALVYDVLADLQRWGFRSVFLVETHGDRVFESVLQSVSKAARDSLGLAFFDPRASRGPGPIEYRVKDAYQPDYHAGAPETAMMLKFFPEEVNIARARSLEPEKGFHPLGYAGDPAGYRNVRVTDERTIEALADGLAAWMKARTAPAQPAS